jgi:hypothetical protein
MIDLFGTPYTKSLHVVERYRLREYDDVKDALERNKKENWLFSGDVFSKHRGKFLQVHLTVEDEGVFRMPWTATLTYVPGSNAPSEAICAENVHQYYYDHSDANVPHAGAPSSETSVVGWLQSRRRPRLQHLSAAVLGGRQELPAHSRSSRVQVYSSCNTCRPGE